MTTLDLCSIGEHAKESELVERSEMQNFGSLQRVWSKANHFENGED